MRHTQVRAQTTRASVHKTRATKGMTSAEARYLANWLSTRVERVAGDVLAVASDHGYERALVASRLAKARVLGLTVVTGGYLPPPPPPASKSSGSTGKRDHDGDEQDERLPHLVHCRSCDLSYRATYLHCCRCAFVFKSASAFERHASGSGAGRCATPEQLRRRRLRLVDGVWRGEPPRSLAG